VQLNNLLRGEEIKLKYIKCSMKTREAKKGEKGKI
jgi:hypothetical protein